MEMDVISIFISIVALIVSIIVAINNNQRETKINQVNLESEYYREIYKEHLIKGIPNARKYIGFTADGRLRDTKELRNELNMIRQDSLYFLYVNKNYYIGLKEITQDLEDYLINNEECIFEGEDRTELLNEIQKKIRNLYKYISDNYLGKTV